MSRMEQPCHSGARAPSRSGTQPHVHKPPASPGSPRTETLRPGPAALQAIHLGRPVTGCRTRAPLSSCVFCSCSTSEATLQSFRARPITIHSSRRRPPDGWPLAAVAGRTAATTGTTRGPAAYPKPAPAPKPPLQAHASITAAAAPLEQGARARSVSTAAPRSAQGSQQQRRLPPPPSRFTRQRTATPAPSSPPLGPPTVMTSFPDHLQPEVLANGLLLIDKPPYWEIPEVVTAVQRAVPRADKVASVAPLDAAASGLLLLCFGAATRLAVRVERASKRYEGSMVLGSTAATADVRGGSFRAGWLPWWHLDDEELQEAADGLLLRPPGGSAAVHLPGGSAAVHRGSRSTSNRSGDASAGGSGTADGPSVLNGGSQAARDDWEEADEHEAKEEEEEEEGATAGASGRVATLEVLSPRYQLRQLPSSFEYVEEDVGCSVRTHQMQVREFRVWRDPYDSEASVYDNFGRNELPPGDHRGGNAQATQGFGAGKARRAVIDRSPVYGNDLGAKIRFSVVLSGRIHVRSLVEMYGRRLRTTACLNELRRTQVGSFDVDDAWALDALMPVLQRYRK